MQEFQIAYSLCPFYVIVCTASTYAFSQYSMYVRLNSYIDGRPRNVLLARCRPEPIVCMLLK